MRKTILLCLAAIAVPVGAQPASAPTQPLNFSASVPATGSWSYRSEGDRSDAVFVDTRGFPRLTLRCDRAGRRITLAVAMPAATGAMAIWTSSETRNLPVRYEQASAEVLADMAAGDSLLDAIAFSRGRFAVVIAGSVPLVVPADAEPARVVEDCRI